MDVFVANEQALSVDETKLGELARHVLTSEGIDDSAELSVLFVTSGHIQRLNHRFAGNDYPTDVLAFPMMEDEETTMLLGDVVICPEVADRQASEYGQTIEQELSALVVHGTLHLLGYDHQNDEEKARMNLRAEEILRTFDQTTV